MGSDGKSGGLIPPDPPERMAEFFEARLDGYEEHMFTIEGAREFYPYTSSLLPRHPSARVLDLGCGTGLELEEYFRLAPDAAVTAVDLSEKCLEIVRKRFRMYNVTTICTNFFEFPFEESTYDAVVSVEAMHHYPREAKLSLYANILRSLKHGGFFILTDYLVLTYAEERAAAEAARARIEAAGADPGVIWHIDIPMTVSHEAEILLAAGFPLVERMETWGSTTCLKATKP